jgi:hypothetical protein
MLLRRRENGADLLEEGTDLGQSTRGLAFDSSLFEVCEELTLRDQLYLGIRTTAVPLQLDSSRRSRVDQGFIDSRGQLIEEHIERRLNDICVDLRCTP